MFWILPVAGQCFNCCEENTLDRTQRGEWTRLEKTGGILDICIIALLSISATLALMTHLGIPTGGLNVSMGFNTILGLYMTSFVLILVDTVKCCRKKPPVSLPLNQQTLLTLPGGTSPPLPGSPSVPLKTTTTTIATTTTTPTTIEKPKPKGHLDPSEDENDPITDLEPGVVADNLSDSFIPINSSSTTPVYQPSMVDSFVDVGETHQMDGSMVLISSYSEPEPQNHVQTAATTVHNGARTLGVGVMVGVNGALNKGLTALEIQFTKSSIQSRLYFLNIGFIIEKMLTYNENKKRFDRALFPITFRDKVALVKNKVFSDPEITLFKVQIIKIIETLGNDYYAIRCAILKLIEDQKRPDKNKKDKEGAIILQPLTSAQTCIQKICDALYTEFEGMAFGRDLVQQLLPLDSPLCFSQLGKIIMEDAGRFEKLESNIRGQRGDTLKQQITGTTGILFSPDLDDNFANTVGSETYVTKDGVHHKVNIIRFGTPTKQDIVSAIIIEQMRDFVEACARRKKTILTFQHQSFATPGEGARLEAVFQLAIEYPKTLFVIHIDMDSDFYKQEGKDVPKQLTYADFRQELIKRQKNLRPSANLRTLLSNVPYEQDLKETANEVRRRAFPKLTDDSMMTIQERKDFIFLFEAQATQYLNAVVLPTYSFGQCKDSRDRTMSILATRYLLNQWELRLENEQDTLMNFRVITHFVAMIIKGASGGMEHKRLERFKSAIEQFTTKSDALIRRPPTLKGDHIAVLEGQSIRGARFDYTYHPLPCDLQDKDQYKASPWLQPTNGHSRSLMSLAGRKPERELWEYVFKLFQNNGLNCSVKPPEGKQFTSASRRFTISQGDIALCQGVFSRLGEDLVIRIQKNVE